MNALKDRPAGLDASELLAYRLGYSRGVAKYLRDNDTPAMAGPKPNQNDPEYAAWRQELHDRTAAFQEGAHEIAQPYAMRSLTAYRKRAGIVTEPPKRAARKVRTKVAEDDSRKILVAIVQARLNGTQSDYEAALDVVMDTLGLAPTPDRLSVVEVRAA